MFKILVSFVSLFLILFFGIDMFRKFTKKEKWSFAKMATYSAVIAVLTIVILCVIVVLF